MVIKLTPVPNSKGKLLSVSRFYSASKLLKWSDSLSNVIASKCNQLAYFCCSNIEKRYFSWICQFSLHWHESEKSNQNWRIFSMKFPSVWREFPSPPLLRKFFQRMDDATIESTPLQKIDTFLRGKWIVKIYASCE